MLKVVDTEELLYLLEHSTYKGVKVYLAKTPVAEVIPIDWIIEWQYKGTEHDPTDIKRIIMQMVKEYRHDNTGRGSRSR